MDITKLKMKRAKRMSRLVLFGGVSAGVVGLIGLERYQWRRSLRRGFAGPWTVDAS